MPAMGMWNNSRAPSLGLRRGLLLLGGLGSVLWSLSALPSFQATTPARDIVARIIADERFKPGALDDALVRLQVSPQPSILQPEWFQAQALMYLRTAEAAMQRENSEEADRAAELAENKVKAALFAIPSDSFLWLMLYSVETNRNGFTPATARFLDQSYARGPNEGWIALRRNRLALTILPLLDPAIQEKVVSEFANIVSSDFTESAAVNFTTVGWVHRDRLLSALESVDIISREAFAKQLARGGTKARVHGIEIDERPWR